MNKNVPISDQERSMLHKVSALIERRDLNKVPPLDDDEIIVLRRALRFFEGILALGVLGGAFKNIIIWVGVLAGAYYGFKNWVFKAAQGAVIMIGLK